MNTSTTPTTSPFIESARGRRIRVELQSDYWGEDYVNSGSLFDGDEVRIDAYGEHLSLDAAEARALAAALVAAADRLDGKKCFICGQGPHQPINDRHSAHSYLPVSDAAAEAKDARGDGLIPSMTAAETLDPREAKA